MNSVVSEQTLRIGLVGTYDVSNFGDCIFPDIYVHQFLKRFPNAEFTLYSPLAVAAEILNFDKVLALPAKLDKASFPEDCLVQTGGETVWVGHTSGTYIFPLDTLSAYLRLWLGPVRAATTSKVKSIIYCVGLPSGDKRVLPVMTRLLQSADYLRLRDKVSQGRLEGVFRTAVDPAFVMSQLQTPEQWAERAARVLPAEVAGKPYLAVQISQSYLSGNLGVWCDAVAQLVRKTDWDVVLLPICRHLNDEELLELAMAEFRRLYPDLAERIYLVRGALKVLDTAAVLAACAGYVGSSLHGAVAAVSFGKPMGVLSKSLDGKHAQTLISAGVEGAVTDRIADLPRAFDSSLGWDLPGNSAEAIRRAEQDFDEMAQVVLADKQPNKPLSPADVEEILAFDRAPCQTPSMWLKRFVFGTMRKVPALWQWYERRKFYGRFSVN